MGRSLLRGCIQRVETEVVLADMKWHGRLSGWQPAQSRDPQVDGEVTAGCEMP